MSGRNRGGGGIAAECILLADAYFECLHSPGDSCFGFVPFQNIPPPASPLQFLKFF